MKSDIKGYPRKLKVVHICQSRSQSPSFVTSDLECFGARYGY